MYKMYVEQSFWYLIKLSRDLELAAIIPKWENVNKIVIFAPIKVQVVSIHMFSRSKNLFIALWIV